MCPPNPPEPNAPPAARPSIEEVQAQVEQMEARLAKVNLPPELRQRLADSARRLAELKAARDSWTKTALALELAEVKKKPAE